MKNIPSGFKKVKKSQLGCGFMVAPFQQLPTQQRQWMKNIPSGFKKVKKSQWF